MSDHIETERWSPLVEALYKGIEGEDWRDVRGLQRIEQACAGEEATGPESKKSLENEGRRENNKYYDATREDNLW